MICLIQILGYVDYIDTYKKDLAIELYEFIGIVKELKDYAKVRDFLSEH